MNFYNNVWDPQHHPRGFHPRPREMVPRFEFSGRSSLSGRLHASWGPGLFLPDQPSGLRSERVLHDLPRMTVYRKSGFSFPLGIRGTAVRRGVPRLFFFFLICITAARASFPLRSGGRDGSWGAVVPRSPERPSPGPRQDLGTPRAGGGTAAERRPPASRS